MDQAAGDKITRHALAPLPDLSTIVFFRQANRDFVTGRGPLAAAAGLGVRRFIRWGMWLFLVTGVGTSLIVGALEFYLHQQRTDLEASLVTVAAKVVGCDVPTRPIPYFVYQAEGKVYQHYTRQTRADICDKKPWQVTYVPGDPDSWAVAPESPLPPPDDDLDVSYIVAGPVLLFLAAIYGIMSWFQGRRAGKEKRLEAEGGLLPAELISAKDYSGAGDSNTPSLRIDYRFTPPDGQTVEKRQSLSRFDATRKTVPPAGSIILVLYVDNELFEAL